MQPNFATAELKNTPICTVNTQAFGTQKPPLNSHADVSSGARVLKFGHSLHIHPYHFAPIMRWLARAFMPAFVCMQVKAHCFVCFVALRPKSTAMVIAGRSVHLTTLFPGQA